MNRLTGEDSEKNGPTSERPWRALKKQRYQKDHHGEDYDRRYSSGLNELNTLVERRWIETHLCTGLILDAGAGTGRFAAVIGSANRRVVALDNSAPMLARLRGKIPDLPLIRSDIYRIPLEDNTFDGAVCMHVLFHLPDWPEVLKELARVVRPGGPVIFEMRSGDHVRLAERVLKLLKLSSSGHKSADRSEHTVYAGQSQVRQAMEDCGLQLQKAFAYDIGHAYYLAPAAGMLDRLLAASWFLRRTTARCELLLGRVLPRSVAYRTLYLGRKL